MEEAEPNDWHCELSYAIGKLGQLISLISMWEESNDLNPADLDELDLS